MIDLMRPVAKIILACFSLCLVLFAGAALWIWQQFNQLPVHDLSVRPAAIGLQHVELHQLSFTYTENAADTAVSIENLKLDWQWDGFTPRLQGLSAAKLQLAVKQLPTATTEHRDTKLTWPDDWQLPTFVPDRIAVDEFRLTLPCGESRCLYHGELYARQQEALEVAAIISTGQPSDLQPSVQLSAYYKVNGSQPKLALQLNSPSFFTIDLDLALTGSKQLRGSADGTMHEMPDWLLREAERWQLALPNPVAHWSRRLPGPWHLQSNWNMQMPAQLDSAWINQLDGSIDAEASIPEVAFLALDLNIEQAANTGLSGRLRGSLQPGGLSWLDNDLPAGLKPYIEQLEEPVDLQASGEFEVAGNDDKTIAHRLNGTANLTLDPNQAFNVESLGQFRVNAGASVDIKRGQLSNYRVNSGGSLSELTQNQRLAELNLNPGNIHWQLQSEGSRLPPEHNWPWQLQLHSDGSTQAILTSAMNIDFTDFSVQSPLTTLTLQQSDWHHQDVELHDIKASLPFSFNLRDNKFSAFHSASAQFSSAFNFAPLRSEQTRINLDQWQVDGDLSNLMGTTLRGAAKAHVTGLTGPQITPQDLNWEGSVAGSAQRLLIEGRLRNSHGLALTQQVNLQPENLQLQWSLLDLFWLAGNPLRDSLTSWPELLTLERGRSNADGKLNITFSPLQLDAQANVDIADVAGLYDTTSFSGVNSQVQIESDGESFAAALKNLEIQRVVRGIEIGPVHAKGVYQGHIDNILQGQLHLTENHAAVFNGQVSVENARYDFADESVLFNVAIAQLDLSDMLSEYPASELSGSGTLSGTIPIRWSNDGLTVDAGKLVAQPPGGELRYRSERAQQLGERNQAMKLVVDALDDFHYSLLESTVSYYDDGTLELALAIQGRNPTWQHERPVHLNVRLQEDLPALIASLQLTNQVNSIIQERVQKRLLESLRR